MDEGWGKGKDEGKGKGKGWGKDYGWFKKNSSSLEFFLLKWI